VNTATLQAIEFDLVKRMLTSRCGSRSGQAILEGLTPHADIRSVRAGLDRASEARRILAFAGRQPFGKLPDVTAVLGESRARGARLEPRGLLDVAAFAADASDILSLVSRTPDATVLAHRASSVPSLLDLAATVRRVVLPSGEVSDQASPRLADIRRTIAQARLRLQEVMTSYVQDRGSARLLQERIISTRNDRYVLLLKAENRGQLPGIIHGASGSGASLFVEPLPAVELNNDIVSLTEDERVEVARILSELTAQVHDRLPDLDRAASVCAELDAHQAIALLANDMQANVPTMTEERRIDLREARHPLLIAALTDPLGLPRRGLPEPIPVSITLGPDEHVLVISGPNTGGKTAALKSLGLLTLMAHCGLPIPAAPESVVPVRSRIFADIGDDQSMVGDLSTFSAHLANIVAMTADATEEALILLDELGSGTDPAEGGALAVAIVDHFRQRGALTIVTTHHSALKEYALRTPGVISASFGYDPSTYAPTYKLRFGSAGRSLALEMAERLGLPSDLLADARARMDPAERDLAEMRRQVEGERSSLAAERDALRLERARLDEVMARERDLVAELEARRRDEIARFRKDLDRRSQTAFERADQAIRQAVRRLESRRGAILRSAAQAREEAAAAVAAAQKEGIEDLAGEPVAQAQPGDLQVGDRVRVDRFGVTATLRALHGTEADVETGGKRLRLPIADLVRLSPRPPGKPARSGFVDGSLRAPSEANLIGLTVDEALPRVDKILDTAILEDRSEVRIIHGHGAGRLRRAVRDMLASHPQVASFRGGADHEGGGGVTIVTLRDA
jgi:DNA mismatch repair protein MutS2